MSSSHSHSPPGDVHDKGVLASMNLGFLKTLTEKKTTRDGQTPKRRGPKPDAKPALTRRQELNRQAQRTHRERKELYIKALEDEVLRLKEVFSNVTQDKDKLAEENRQLKMLLSQNGLAGAMDDLVGTSSLGYTTSSPSVSGRSGSYATGSTATAFTPPMTSQSNGTSGSNSSHMAGVQSHGLQAPGQYQGATAQQRVDYDQAGIDFVLTLEAPCMDHLPWLVERASEAGGEACGHALMASCPPEPFNDLSANVPFGYNHAQPEQNRSGQRTWELTKGDLSTLLDLSKKLDLDGEITPVMAWGTILNHPRFGDLKLEDIHRLSDELKGKVRCYGFGAVMEEFEVRDALNAVFSHKPDFNLAF